jgi:2-haloacid dehalogenase
MKKTVVFDLGGVLIDWDPRRLYRKLMDDEAQVEAFLRDVCSLEWHFQQDLGRSIAEAIADRVALFPQYEHLITAYYARWGEMLDGAFDTTVEILRELKEAGVQLYALTNFSTETLPIARKHYEFLNWFDDIVVSGHERIGKPDARFYEILLHRHSLDAADCIFIDDVLKNVKAAEKLGFQAIHFTPTLDLRACLLQHQVIENRS